MALTHEAIDQLACCIASAEQDAEDNEDPDFSERSAAIADGLRDLARMLGVDDALAPLIRRYMDEHHEFHHDHEEDA